MVCYVRILGPVVCVFDLWTVKAAFVKNSLGYWVLLC